MSGYYVCRTSWCAPFFGLSSFVPRVDGSWGHGSAHSTNAAHAGGSPDTQETCSDRLQTKDNFAIRLKYSLHGF
eukprot:6462585-Amphidinium_carterae.1